MDAEVALEPVTFTPLPEIQNPFGLLPPVKARATVYGAPGARVALLGVAFTDPPAVWQVLQVCVYPTWASAGAAWTVTTKNAAANPAASTAIFGMVIRVTL